MSTAARERPGIFPKSNERKESLIKALGKKTAQSLVQFASGVDCRVLGVVAELKSVGVQLSYGVRCACRADVLRYIQSLCDLLAQKVEARGVHGSKLVLKLYKRIPVSFTPKFMGHGPVDVIRYFTGGRSE